MSTVRLRAQSSLLATWPEFSIGVIARQRAFPPSQLSPVSSGLFLRYHSGSTACRRLSGRRASELALSNCAALAIASKARAGRESECVGSPTPMPGNRLDGGRTHAGSCAGSGRRHVGRRCGQHDLRLQNRRDRPSPPHAFWFPFQNRACIILGWVWVPFLCPAIRWTTRLGACAHFLCCSTVSPTIPNEPCNSLIGWRASTISRTCGVDYSSSIAGKRSGFWLLAISIRRRRITADRRTSKRSLARGPMSSRIGLPGPQ